MNEIKIPPWQMLNYPECKTCEFNHEHWDHNLKKNVACCDKILNDWHNLSCPGKEADKARDKKMRELARELKRINEAF